MDIDSKKKVLVILIKNIYTSWGRKRFLLTVTYFQTNVVYPFTLRVTGITNGLRTGKEYFFKIVKYKQGRTLYSRVPRLSDTRYLAKGS